MLLELLVISSIVIFLIFFVKLGKEWYGPYTLFTAPFILMFVVALFNKGKWGLDLELETFLVFFTGILFFLMGCWVAKNVCVQKLVSVKPTLYLYPRKNINNTRLLIVDGIMFVLFAVFLYKIYSYGKANNMSITEAINYIMMLSKFEPDKTTITIPFMFQVFLQINYLAAYLYSFFIARRIIYRDRSNLFLLLVGYFLSMATCFLNGSRGPLVENLIALVLAFGIAWHQRYGMKIFPRKILIGLVVFLIIAVVAFFAMLPLLGRGKTAESLGDSITQYIGSQVYNLNYFIKNVNTKTTFFGADTFDSLYNDLQTLGIPINYKEGAVKIFFVKANGHDMGNVFTCFFSLYVDFGIIGVGLLSFFMGWISQKVFDGIKKKRSIVDFCFVIYLYIAANLLFCFFGQRFFQNVIQIKSILKFIWLYLIFWFVSESDVKIPYQQGSFSIYQGFA